MRLKALVCGDKDYTDKDSVYKILDNINPTVVVQGGVPGVAALAKEWAIDNNKVFTSYPPNWKKNGRTAGIKRNKYMFLREQPNLVIAFPGGRDTKNMLGLALDHPKATTETIRLGRGNLVTLVWL